MYSNQAIRDIFALLYAYGGIILFPLVVIEGPIVTIIAGVLASLGVLSPIPTYLTVVAADLTGDVLYYSLGRWWLKPVLTKLTRLFKVSMKTIEKVESSLRRNQGKVLFFAKLSHVLGMPIMLAAGHAKIPISDYLWFNFLATLPKSLIFLSVGYLLGTTITNYNKYLNLTILGILILAFLMFGISYLSNRITKKYFNHNH